MVGDGCLGRGITVAGERKGASARSAGKHVQLSLDYLVTTAIQYVILFSTAALTTGPMGADSNIGTRRTNTLHGTAWHGTGQEIKPRHYTASRTKAGYTVNTMRVLSAQPVGSCTFRHGCYLGQVVSPMSAPCLETRAEYDA